MKSLAKKILFLSLLLLPLTVSSQSVFDLQNQIQNLLDQVQELQEKLSQKTGDFYFTKDLYLGLNNQEVLNLQKKLNQSADTKIASSGPGSKGQETSYFGPLTKQSVIQFQIKNNIFPASGFVGSLTRAVLNNVSVEPDFEEVEDKIQVSSYKDIYETDKRIEKYQKTLISQAKSGSDPDNFEIEGPFLFDITPISVNPGNVLTLQGLNLDNIETVHFGPTYQIDVNGSTESRVVISVPQIPSGKYDLALEGGNEISNTMPVVISNSNNSPNISNVSPKEITLGDKVIISGKGFSKEGNDVQTRFGVFKDLDSNGQTIEFDFSPESISGTYVDSLSYNISWPFYFRVINENGVSDYSEVITFVLE